MVAAGGGILEGAGVGVQQENAGGASVELLHHLVQDHTKRDHNVESRGDGPVNRPHTRDVLELAPEIHIERPNLGVGGLALAGVLRDLGHPYHPARGVQDGRDRHEHRDAATVLGHPNRVEGRDLLTPSRLLESTGFPGLEFG